MRKPLPKFSLLLFSIFIIFQIPEIYGSEEVPIVTINFVSGNTIDLDTDPHMIRANIEIQNYNPQDGYHYMQIIRTSDEQIIKTTEIFPKLIDDDLYNVQILHYLDPDADEKTLIGNYEMRIFSELGTSETTSTFSIIKSSMPELFTQNSTEILETSEEVDESLDNPTTESLQLDESTQTESKIPIWVHDIFVWYADETISENELLTAIEYLISQGILNVNTS